MGAYKMCLLTENQPRILFPTNLILILMEFWIQSACRRHLGCDVNINMKIGKQWNRGLNQTALIHRVTGAPCWLEDEQVSGTGESEIMQSLSS